MTSPQEHRGATPTQSFRFSLLSKSVSCQRPIFLKLKKKKIAVIIKYRQRDLI